MDKILWLATALPEFDFDVIGADSGLGIGQPANVHVHKFCNRHEYEPVLAQADVALGTLALHRKSMQQAAPLKVREYLLRGIPVIIGYDDPDLRDDLWYVLRLPNDERNVRLSVDAIRTFVHTVAGKRVPRHEVAGRIDIVAKERRRLRFLRSFVHHSE